MGLYGIIEPLMTFSYTPLQILGVLAIVGVAIAVVMFFSTLWSVERTRNEGTDLNEKDIIFSRSHCEPSSITVRRIDREDIRYSGEEISNIRVTSTRYSYEKTYLQILNFSIGNRHYILDHVIREMVESNKIVMVGEYSCSASLVEDIVDTPHEITFEYDFSDPKSDSKSSGMRMIDTLVRMHSDELTHLYQTADFECLNDSDSPYPDTLQRDMRYLRTSFPGLIDLQTGTRSLLFIMFYKILDPGFRSIGLSAIQDFTILMSMHVEVLRMMNMVGLLEKSENGTDGDEEVKLAASTIMIEDAIRRFVTKRVTSQKRRTDIFDILNRYVRILRDPLSNHVIMKNQVTRLDDKNEIDGCLCMEKDLHILAISARMYGEILVKLADPDSNLHNDEVSRLYALLAPLYSMVIEENEINPTRIKVGEGDLYRVIMDEFVGKIDLYFKLDEKREPPNDLIDMLKATLINSRADALTYEEGLCALIYKVWKSYDLGRRAITSDNCDTYVLLKPPPL